MGKDYINKNPKKLGRPHISETYAYSLFIIFPNLCAKSACHEFFFSLLNIKAHRDSDLVQYIEEL